MQLGILTLLIGSVACSSALADACNVAIGSPNPDLAKVEVDSCYEFRGMPADSMDWSCSNENTDMLASRKSKVASCREDYRSKCTSALTQETLANHKSTRQDPQSGVINIPDDARVITYFYRLENRHQAKADCENGGGKWQDK